MKELKTMAGLLTDKGNIKNAVRADLHAQVASEYLGAFTKQPNGEYTMDLVESDGTVIKAVIALSISTRDNFDKKARKEVEAKVEQVINLFD